MAALIAFYVLFPVVVIRLCLKFKFLNKIGAVILCYITGIMLGNCGILPQGAAGLQDTLSSASVAIALPLLLFSMDVRAWLKLVGKAILSMTGAIVIVVAVAGAGTILVRDHVTDAWKLSGMAISVYTGGTPNMAAIKTALSVDPTTFIILHTYDTLISLIYIICVMSFGQKLFNRFLPPFKQAAALPGNGTLETEDINSYENMLNRRTIKQLAWALILALAILGIALAVAALFPEHYSTSITILMITSLGIAASFVKNIRTLEKTFQFGMYMILIFCLVVSSMANLKDLVDIHWALMFFVSFCVFGSFVVHAVFCKVFNIDTDTFLITSVSAICSPPFVPVVAGALKNKQIILSGLTTGIMGYALGNYLGISFAYIFKALTG